MKKNMGTIDRVVRIVVAVVIVVLYFLKLIPGTPGILLLALSAILLTTSTIAVCPLYLPLRLSTRRKE